VLTSGVAADAEAPVKALLSLPLAVASALVAVSSARPQAPPAFGASADLVVIDLIATDGDGRLVTDLRPEEIEVCEDGKRQRVEFARFVTAGDRAASALSSSPPPAGSPAPPAVRPSPDPPLSLVVVVDLATMPFDLLAHTRDAVLRMAREGLEPGTRLMLVTLDRGLQVPLPFTDDVPAFVAAAEKMNPSPGEGDAALAELVDQVENTCDGTPGAVTNAVALGRAYVENARLGLQDATEGLGALARYLAPLPGRKHVVFYSAGYPMQPASIAAAVVEGICSPPSGIPGRSYMQAGPSEAQTALRVGAQIDSTGMLRALLDEANRAQVSVYTVDARGLVSDAVPARSRVPTRIVRSGQVQAVTQRAVRAPQEILYSIAEGTGGTASVNTNELARGLHDAATDARGYYLLAYAPPGGRKEGRYYPIEVKATRPGLHLRYRRGYEWRSEAKRSERALSAALRFPGLFADNGLALDPWLEAGRLHVAVILPTRSLAFRAEGTLHRNEIAIQGLLRDEQGRPVGDRFLFTKTIDMKLPEDRYADLRSRGNLEIANEAPAPKKGRYQVAVAVRHSGGRLASATAGLVVP
jgi:VWFA-related protein